MNLAVEPSFQILEEDVVWDIINTTSFKGEMAHLIERPVHAILLQEHCIPDSAREDIDHFLGAKGWRGECGPTDPGAALPAAGVGCMARKPLTLKTAKTLTK